MITSGPKAETNKVKEKGRKNKLTSVGGKFDVSES